MNALNAAVDAAIPLIERRLGMQAPFSEDALRRLVLDELDKSGIPAMRLAMEYPHPNIPGARVDAVILDGNRTPQAAIEFKYHRKIPSSHNQPRTMKAGELLTDFARLRDFPNVQRYVIYLTDGEMLRYLGNICNGLYWLLYTKEQEISDANLPNTATLRRTAGDWTRPALSQTLLNRDVGIDHRLIVWQVKPRAIRQGHAL